MIPHAVSIIRGVSITVGIHSVTWDHPKREAILQAIREQRWDDIEPMISPAKAVLEFGDGQLQIVDNQVYYKGEIVSGRLHGRILDMIAQDLSIGPFLAFLDRVRQNPSKRVIDCLFDFLDFGQLPLTETGTFLARKVVGSDFWSYHSGKRGKVNWAPGESPEMPRNEVDDDPDRTCSDGLHVYNRDYGKQFMGPGGRFLVIEVAPEDVVSIPRDYNNTKMRVCRATSLAEITREDDPEFFGSLVYIHPQTGAVDADFVPAPEADSCCANCDADLSQLPKNMSYCPYCGYEL